MYYYLLKTATTSTIKSPLMVQQTKQPVKPSAPVQSKPVTKRQLPENTTIGKNTLKSLADDLKGRVADGKLTNDQARDLFLQGVHHAALGARDYDTAVYLMSGAKGLNSYTANNMLIAPRKADVKYVKSTKGDVYMSPSGEAGGTYDKDTGYYKLDLGIGGANFAGIPYHELGHYIDYNRGIIGGRLRSFYRNPTKSRLSLKYFGEDVPDPNHPGRTMRVLTETGKAQAQAASHLLAEINANRMANRYMQRALKDKPELYRQWKREFDLQAYHGLSSDHTYDNLKHFPAILTKLRERNLNGLADKMEQQFNMIKTFNKNNNNAVYNHLTDPKNTQIATLIFKRENKLNRFNRNSKLRDALYDEAVRQGMDTSNAWYNKLDTTNPAVREQIAKLMYDV